MVIKYEQPDEFLYDGGANDQNYLNERIDIRRYIVDQATWSTKKNQISLAGGRHFVILKGPLKVAASSESSVEGARKHTTDIATVPSDENVRFENYQQKALGRDVNLKVAPVLKPLQFPPVGPLFRLKLVTSGYPLYKQFWWFKYNVERVE